MNLSCLLRSSRKKVRGIRRKFNRLEEILKEETKFYPICDEQYWHTHIPTRNDFVDSCKTPIKIRRQIIQLLVDRVYHLVLKKSNLTKGRVTALVSIPFIWDSEITIFNDEDYFNCFFDRNDDWQQYIPIEDTSKFTKQYHISVPSCLDIKGYKTIFREDGEILYVGELWVIGEL